MADYGSVMADREAAAGVLELIQAFVNTVDLQRGTEEFTDPGSLTAWFRGRGLMMDGQPANVTDLKHAIAVREAIRGLIGANARPGAYPLDIATLNEAVAASRLRARFGSDRTARLEPEAIGVEGALGRIAAALFAATAQQDFNRLKLCGSRSCRRVFYDRSRNRSSRWCEMASCGNRQKARRFRERAKAT
jgi:predicted RNA-binding Zn ribbon-like protein